MLDSAHLMPPSRHKAFLLLRCAATFSPVPTSAPARVKVKALFNEEKDHNLQLFQHSVIIHTKTQHSRYHAACGEVSCQGSEAGGIYSEHGVPRETSLKRGYTAASVCIITSCLFVDGS